VSLNRSTNAPIVPSGFYRDKWEGMRAGIQLAPVSGGSHAGGGGGGGFHGDGGGPRTRHGDSDHSRAVDELLSQERQHHKSELIGLELAIAKLEDAVSGGSVRLPGNALHLSQRARRLPACPHARSVW